MGRQGQWASRSHRQTKQLLVRGGAGRAHQCRLHPPGRLGLRFTKESLEHAIDAGSLEQTIAMEDRNHSLARSTRDFRECVAAFLRKRLADLIGPAIPARSF